MLSILSSWRAELQATHYKMAGETGSQSTNAAGCLTVDISALSRNYDALARKAYPSRVAAVVKADAYGLGANRVARKLYQRGCKKIFVAQLMEACDLRPALPPDAEIYILNGLQPGSERHCAAEALVPVINSIEQWKNWKSLAIELGRRLPAVVQFDTGMSRLGIAPDERRLLAEELTQGSRHIDILYLMSHLASADDEYSAQNDNQRAAFARIKSEFPGYGFSLANSAGVFLGEDYCETLARPGIALYGGSPLTMNNLMEPVVQLDVAVIQVRVVPGGTKVGYGGVHITTAETRLATIAAGYADGIPRSLSGRGAAYYQGTRLPIVGRVSMDSTIVDVSALPVGALQLGSLVEVIGPNQTIEDVARDAATISYEILTGLGHRFCRVYR